MATIRKGNSHSGTLKTRWMMWTDSKGKPAQRRIPISSIQLKQPTESAAFYRLPAKSPWVCRKTHTLGLFAAPDVIWDDFIPKWGDFTQKKRYLKIQVPQNQQTNHPRFSKLRNGIAPMPEPHRRGVAIANGFSKGKCDEIPPQARFFLYKNAPPTTLEGRRKPF